MNKKKFMKLMALILIELVILLPVAFALQITIQPTTSAISSNGAQVSFETDIPTTGRVEYGRTRLLGDTATSPEGTSHQVSLTGLQPDTNYYYRAVVKDELTGQQLFDNNAGAYYSFTTNLPVDTTAPVISDVHPADFTTTSLKLVWTTDDASTSEVHYGVRPNIDNVLESTTLVNSHTVQITDLTEGTLYAYMVRSCNADSRCSEETGIVRAGIDRIPPSLDDFIIPELSNNRNIDITGTTEPATRIQVYVNDRMIRSGVTDDDGFIAFRGLVLDLDVNTIRLQATDAAGNVDSLTATVTFDNSPPLFSILNFEDVSTASSFRLHGRVNEPAKVRIYTSLELDKDAPDRITGVTVTEFTTSRISLSWTPLQIDDFLQYGIYRNNELYATTTSANYVDAKLPPNTQYVSYRIAAVDTSCNKGPLSDSLQVELPANVQASTDVVSPELYRCEKPVKEFDAQAGDFVQAIPLFEGPNKIRVVLEDLAGNKAEYVNTTLYDTAPPTFEETNLEELSPTYLPLITLRGKVSEKATVFIYINDMDSPVEIEVTDDQGNFEVRNMPLSLEFIIKDVGTGGTDVTEGYRNTIRIIAIDAAGRQSAPLEQDVIYAKCGAGGLVSVTISEPLPGILSPRLILENQGRIGFNINITKSDPDIIITSDPTFRYLDLSRGEQDDWDRNLQFNAVIWNEDKTAGYVELSIPPPSFPTDMPRLQQEMNLSMHRAGDCLIPELGCYKIPLVLEIEHERPRARGTVESRRTGLVSADVTHYVQKECIPMFIFIDKPVPTELIPKKWLANSVRVLEDVIDALDQAIKPLTDFVTYTTYICLGGVVILFVYALVKEFQCNQIFSFIEGSAAFKVENAENGVCYLECGKDGNCGSDTDKKDKYDECTDCQDSIDNIRWAINKMNWLCDRIFCPSVPSLQKYIDDSAGGKTDCAAVFPKAEPAATTTPTTSSTGGTQDPEADFGSSATTTSGTQDPVADFGSTAAVADVTGALTSITGLAHKKPISQTGKQPKSYIDKMNEVWASWDTRNHKNDANKEDTGEGGLSKTEFDYWVSKTDGSLESPAYQGFLDDPAAVNCDVIHPQTAECCAYQYNNEFNSACIFMNELEESLCILRKNNPEAFPGLNCGPLDELVHSFGGACDPSGFGTGTIINTGGSKDVNNNDVWIKVYGVEEYSKLKGRSSTVAGQRGGNIIVKRGIKQDLIKGAGQDDLLGESFAFEENADLSDIFRGNPSDLTWAKKKTKFIKTFCNSDPKVQNCSPSQAANAKRAFEKIVSIIRAEEDDMIVDPSTGFLQGLYCACVPSTLAYLKKIRSLTNAVRSCLKSIEVTGDGSEGPCRELLSQGVCDVIYEIISCGVNLFSSANKRADTSGELDGVGKLFSSVAGAGQTVEQSVEGRYGSSNMYKTLFDEKTIVNAICLFAFTGSWDLDVDALVAQSADSINVDSQAYITPKRRRWLRAIDAEGGIAVHAYRFAFFINAGADLTVKLEMKCSSDYSCDSAEAFPNGQCDCRKGEKIMTVPLQQSRVSKYDTFQDDILYTLQDDIRYDKVRLIWEYKDNEGKPTKDQTDWLSIQQEGNFPNYCAFDAIEGKFSCQLGFTEANYAKFSGTPTKNYPTQGDNRAFVLEQKVEFSIPIAQRVPRGKANPASPDNEYTQYLIYRVKDSLGNMVAHSSSGYTLTNDPWYYTIGDGRGSGLAGLRMDQIQKSQKMNIDNGEKYVLLDFGALSERWFSALHGGTTQRPSTFPTEYAGYFSAFGSSNYNTLIEVHNNQGTLTITEKYSTAPFPLTATGYGRLASEQTYSNNQFAEVYKLRKDDLRLRFTPDFKRKITGGTDNKVQIYIPAAVRASGFNLNICKNEYGKKTRTFTLELELHPAEENLGSYRPAMAITRAAGGIEQKTSITFDVICSKDYTSSVAATPTGAAVRCQENVPMTGGACICQLDEPIFPTNPLAAQPQPNCGWNQAGTAYTITPTAFNKNIHDRVVCSDGQCIPLATGSLQNWCRQADNNCQCKPPGTNDAFCGPSQGCTVDINAANRCSVQAPTPSPLPPTVAAGLPGAPCVENKVINPGGSNCFCPSLTGTGGALCGYESGSTPVANMVSEINSGNYVAMVCTDGICDPQTIGSKDDWCQQTGDSDCICTVAEVCSLYEKCQIVPGENTCV